ncbi:hypothetical protein AUC43_15475 [Hymenobacter sedentarius]|uniref:Uncharacterized protein n=1 Tax=Hymenobacter sedentarius TaxID=1411621 RepID=A0A0U4BII1_9BACT|nr:hypothetical protein [Hymenobacter sedentarius]ALW86363.1 hypothetical protein AUC43_15475 [Hymenobacter sedentarius]
MEKCNKFEKPTSGYTSFFHNRLNKGGHFAAWQQSELFSGEMRAAFKSQRKPTAQETAKNQWGR